LLLSATDKFNLRFIYILQYLLQFNFNIRYKTDCLNTVSDALFRLSVLIDRKKADNIEELDKINIFVFEIEILKINRFVEQIFREKKNLVVQTIFDRTIFFYIYLIEINTNFRKQLLNIYIKSVK